MKPQAFHWKILVLVLFITLVNYVDRSALAYAILPIEKILGNAEQFGYIASAFGVGYFAASFLAGVMVDRFGSICTWSLFCVIWSLAMISMGLAQGFWSFFLLCMLLGIAEAIHFPALLKTVAEWLPSAWKAGCLGLGLLGVPFLSSLLLYALIGKSCLLRQGSRGLYGLSALEGRSPSLKSLV